MATAHNQASKFLLALPDDLRAVLQREAFVNRRSLTAELVIRLEQSVVEKASPAIVNGMYPVLDKAQAHKAEEPAAPYGVAEIEQALLAAFRRLPAEKQKGLLTLLG